MMAQPPRRPGPGLGCLLALVPPGLVAAVITFTVLASIAGGCRDALHEAATGTTAPTGTGVAARVVEVQHVSDGDTFSTTDGTTVRLIGVDTPETHKPATPIQCWGPEASAHAKRTLDGARVRLVYETRDGQPDPRKSARTDRYGRTLAYVYLANGTFWNRQLVAQGFAVARYYPPNDDHRTEFAQTMQRAIAAKAGLWGACPSPPPGPGP